MTQLRQQIPIESLTTHSYNAREIIERSKLYQPTDHFKEFLNLYVSESAFKDAHSIRELERYKH